MKHPIYYIFRSNIRPLNLNMGMKLIRNLYIIDISLRILIYLDDLYTSYISFCKITLKKDKNIKVVYLNKAEWS